MGGAVLEQLRGCCERGLTATDLAIEQVDLQGADLSGLRAQGLKLREVDLRAATLSRAEWTECTLSEVRLENVVAESAILRLCVLETVRASDSNWRGAKIENCQATGMLLDRAILTGGSLIDTDLTRASLRSADLRDVDASGATFRGADLRAADLRGASFVDADLRGADLAGAQLEGADFDGADLRGAIRDGDETDRFSSVDAAPGVELPPQFAAIMDAVAPSVVDILQRGKQRGVINDEAFSQILEDMGKTGVSNLDAAQSWLSADGPMGEVLKRVSETGIAPLLAALRTGGKEPPTEVAQLIHTLMGDAKLAPGATAEDLLVHLVKQMQSSVSTGDSRK